MYKNTLEDAEIMLKTKQNQFMNSLMEKQIDIRMRVKNLAQMFLETAPISTEWKSNGIFQIFSIPVNIDYIIRVSC